MTRNKCKKSQPTPSSSNNNNYVKTNELRQMMEECSMSAAGNRKLLQQRVQDELFTHDELNNSQHVKWQSRLVKCAQDPDMLHKCKRQAKLSRMEDDSVDDEIEQKVQAYRKQLMKQKK
jgi:hypothetical protein